jgi:hypothetical protein
MQPIEEPPGVTYGPSGTLGTEWVPVGEGETLNKLAGVFSASPYWQNTNFALVAAHNKQWARTNLKCTGSPMTSYDYARMASSALKVEAT